MLRRRLIALGGVALVGAPIKGIGELLGDFGGPAPASHGDDAPVSVRDRREQSAAEHVALDGLLVGVAAASLLGTDVLTRVKCRSGRSRTAHLRRVHDFPLLVKTMSAAPLRPISMRPQVLARGVRLVPARRAAAAP